METSILKISIENLQTPNRPITELRSYFFDDGTRTLRATYNSLTVNSALVKMIKDRNSYPKKLVWEVDYTP